MRTFRISNTALDSLPFQGFNLTFGGVDAAGFTLLDPLPRSLPCGQSIEVRVSLIGPVAGAKNATLNLTNKSAIIPTITVSLVGSVQTGVSINFRSASDGTISLAGPDLSGSTLDLSLNFAPPVGTQLTVIKNIGAPLISGTFSNLPNGSTVNLAYGGTIYPFIAWYYGGDGNDLVLLWPTTGLAAWGQNATGQLGDTTTTQRNNPTAVVQSGTLTNRAIAQVASGSSHSLALTTDGKVYAWGYNGNGQLGDGSFVQRNNPVPVNSAIGSALSGRFVVRIAAGASHSLALCSDGSIVAWGSNTRGQLGDASISKRNSPVVVNTTRDASSLFGKSAVSISAGSEHSLALCSDGSVVAWGAKASPLGDSSIPIAVSVESGSSALFGKSVVALAAGGYHSLALCSDGSLVAWGLNLDGELGDASTTSRSLPIAVNTTSVSSALFGKFVVTIAAGYSHSLALCSDGSLVAWGLNSSGQLGDTSTSNRSSPIKVNTSNGSSALFGKSIVRISTGSFHSLALCSDGSVAAWGLNSSGQLGDSSIINRPNPVAVGTNVGTSILSGRTATALSTGYGVHSLAIYAAPSPSLKIEILEPTPTTLVNGISTVDFGAKPSGGSVRTFRISNPASTSFPLQGLAVGLSGTDAAAFTLLDPLPSSLVFGEPINIRAVLTSPTPGAKNASLQFTNTGSIVPSFTVSLTGTIPTTVAVTLTASTAGALELYKPADLSAFTLELTLDQAPPLGTQLTVIKNNSRPFFTGTFSNVPNGAKINLSYGGVTYPFIAWYYGGDGNDLVLLWPWTGLAGWGANSSGQLGDATTTLRTAPVAVDQSGVLAGKVVVQIASGGSHTLALTTEGKVYAWGYNAFGQLGDASVTDRTAPVAVNTTSGTSALFGKLVVAVFAGSYHSFALCSDGTLVAWGNNSSSQLGDGSTTNRNRPVAVNTASGSSALFSKSIVAGSSGDSHALVLCADGTLVSWGANTYGQLGDGTIVDRSLPVAVSTVGGSSILFGKSIVSISAGYSHSLARCSDGSVAAWGNNSVGQLGDGSTSNRTSPVAVNTATGFSALSGKSVVTVSAGYNHSLALCSDGSITGWGWNSSGQLGDESNTNRIYPIMVSTVSASSALYGKSAMAIAAGNQHSLALCSDGSVTAWGRNGAGQLGDGSNSNRSTPVAVNTLSGTSALANRPVGAITSGAFRSYSIALYSIRPPTVTTDATTAITTATATLKTTINPNGTATTAWFEYGPSTTPNTTYHFRTVASIFGGTIYGDDQTFQTLPIPPLTLWKQSSFGTDAANPLIAGNMADPDGDGFVNLLEYATRSDPNASSASPLGSLTSVLVQPGDIPAYEFFFPYRTEAKDVRFVIQRSPDLSTWTEIYRFDASTGLSTPVGNVIGITNPTAQTITVTDPATGAKQFWRLFVEPTP